MSFEKPDFEKYPSLNLGYEVVEQGGLAGQRLTLLKEALDNFMSCNLSFPGMADVVEQHWMNCHQKMNLTGLMQYWR